jgi:hypothetical protein
MVSDQSSKLNPLPTPPLPSSLLTAARTLSLSPCGGRAQRLLDRRSRCPPGMYRLTQQGSARWTCTDQRAGGQEEGEVGGREKRQLQAVLHYQRRQSASLILSPFLFSLLQAGRRAAWRAEWRASWRGGPSCWRAGGWQRLRAVSDWAERRTACAWRQGEQPERRGEGGLQRGERVRMEGEGACYLTSGCMRAHTHAHTRTHKLSHTLSLTSALTHSCASLLLPSSARAPQSELSECQGRSGGVDEQAAGLDTQR